MRYDVVIPTLNRPDTLRQCLALIEAQSVLPARVIIIDASDDHDNVKSKVLAGRSQEIEYVFLRSPRKNAAFQRNYGLPHVVSDIALFPDDDAMLFPGTAAEILSAYQLDTKGQVAGVSGIAAVRHPLAGAEQLERSRALKDRIEPVRNQLENRFMPKPFNSYPQSLWKQRDIPSWIDDDRYALIEMTGGLGSLRAELVKAQGFDDTLGYGIGYALHEDQELSMRLQTAGFVLVGARRAPIFHDAHPSKRAGGFNYGFCWFANYLYACRKNMPVDHPSYARHLSRFLQYKLFLYRARAIATQDQYNRDVLEGARKAWERRADLLTAERSDLAEAYKRLCDECLQPR